MYSGDSLDDAPDIIIEFNKIYHVYHKSFYELEYDGYLEKSKWKSGSHSPNGILLLYGENLYKDNIGEYYAILARHFIESENYEKGAEYSKLAARKAEKTSSFIDAIAHTERRVKSLEKISWSKNNQKRHA